MTQLASENGGSFEKKIKIAVLVRRFVKTGGKERYAVEVTRRLAEEHDVHVFAQEWEPEISENITFHHVPKFYRRPRILDQWMFSLFVHKATKKGYDIIHSHERVTGFDVLTIHSPCFKTFITREGGRWRKILKWVGVVVSPRQLGWLVLEKRQFSLEQCKLFIAVSENVKRNVQMNYNLPDETFMLAYPGVDTNMMRVEFSDAERQRVRSDLGLKKNEVVVVFVGTEFRRKGLDALLKAFSSMRRQGLKLVVAGGGGGKLEYYKALASRLGVGDTVVYAGLVPDIEKIYAIADINILPTLSDPGPMTPLEAMACGVATIISSSEYAGTAEHVKNDEALIINNPRDSEEIEQLLMKVMCPDFRQKLAEQGRNLAKQLTWEKTTAETLAAYREILKRRHSKKAEEAFPG